MNKEILNMAIQNKLKDDSTPHVYKYECVCGYDFLVDNSQDYPCPKCSRIFTFKSEVSA